jgi:hypothetical protein
MPSPARPIPAATATGRLMSDDACPWPPLAEAGQHTARPRRGVVNCSDLQANPSTEVQQGRVCLVYGNEFELAKKQLACDPSEGIEFPQTHPRLLFSVLK